MSGQELDGAGYTRSEDRGVAWGDVTWRIWVDAAGRTRLAVIVPPTPAQVWPGNQFAVAQGAITVSLS